jgi:cobalt-zinc-cadmium efflux system membrane fusion protein
MTGERGTTPVRGLVRTGSLLLAALALGCARPATEEHGHGEGASDHAEAQHVERGPQGGRLFEGDGVRLELVIAEDGIPPEFRAHLYDARGHRLPPEGAQLAVVLERFGGRRDTIGFRPEAGFLRGVRSVEEPHSFVATVRLDRQGRRETWSFEQHEGRVELKPEAVAAGDIRTDVAGPRAIEVRIETPGEVRLNAERVVQIRPRFPGVIQRLDGRLGDVVSAGDVLAVVHSDESLTDYDITAPMAGTIVARDVAVGENVDRESAMFTVADLSTVWVDFALYPQLAGQVRRGQTVRIRAGSEGAPAATGTIAYVGPLLEQDTRVSYGRVVLANTGGRWTPGLYVTAAISVDRFSARVAVPEAAIVRTSRGPAVFRAAGSTFELQPVSPGRSDGEWTEIVAGLEAGARVVTRNAFLLKAELGKSEASHDH